jgi:hypothetical protein
MHKTLMAAAMTTVLSGVTALPLTAQSTTYWYRYTQDCAIPPGGTNNACITVKWEYKSSNNYEYWLVRPISVVYRNDSTNGTATFSPNNYFAYTVNRGSCVQPYVGLQSYGAVNVNAKTVRRPIPFPNTAFQPNWRCPAFSTPVRIGGGSTVTLTARWSGVSVPANF